MLKYDAASKVLCADLTGLGLELVNNCKVNCKQAAVRLCEEDSDVVAIWTRRMFRFALGISSHDFSFLRARVWGRKEGVETDGWPMLKCSWGA